MKREQGRGAWLAAAVLLLGGVGALRAQDAQTPVSSEEAVRIYVERYLRYLYAWGPEVTVEVGPLRQSTIPGLATTMVRLKEGENLGEEIFFVGGGGRYIIQGQFLDTTEDLFAANVRSINIANAPSLGPADAPVTVVEYADFQCPTCAALAPQVKKLLAQYSNVRFVFKDFPLTQFHNWAVDAAVAGGCAFQQSPGAFWKLHDFLFANQKDLTAENLQTRLEGWAAQNRLNVQAFAACRQDPASSKRVEDSLAEGRNLQVAGTPTFFVNGRRVSGQEGAVLLERYVRFEVTLRAPPAQPAPPADTPAKKGSTPTKPG